MTLTEKLEALLHAFRPEDREDIAKLIIAAADYVRAVAVMLTESRNFFGRTEEDRRTAAEAADRHRTICHNAFIDRTNLVNRMCAAYGLEPLYTGGPERREYGSFAMELVSAMVASR